MTLKNQLSQTWLSKGKSKSKQYSKNFNMSIRVPDGIAETWGGKNLVTLAL